MLGGSSATRRTAACAVNEHRDCPHRMRLGGGYSRGRPFNSEFTVELCRCPCHAPCPCGGLDCVSLDAWRQSCVCPGSDRMREEEDRLRQGHRPEPPPDFGEILRSMQSRTSVRRDARDAVIARSAGKSRREIRQLLIEELLSRKLEIPSEPILDADVDFIAQGACPLAAGKQVLRALAAVRTARREIAGVFKDAQIMRGPTSKAAYFVIPDRSRPMVDVILDPGAYHLLTTSPEPIPVSLESEKPTSRGTAQCLGV